MSMGQDAINEMYCNEAGERKMNDKKFVDGLMIKPPHERAPDFVKCSISIKRKELGNWLRNEADDWINIDVKESQGGKWYAEVNTWKPENKEEQKPSGGHDSFADMEDIPFMRHHDEYFG